METPKALLHELLGCVLHHRALSPLHQLNPLTWQGKTGLGSSIESRRTSLATQGDSLPPYTVPQYFVPFLSLGKQLRHNPVDFLSVSSKFHRSHASLLAHLCEPRSHLPQTASN